MHLLYVSLFSKCLKPSHCPVWKHSLYLWIGLSPHPSAGQPSPPAPPHLGLWISVSSCGQLTQHCPRFKMAALSAQGQLFEFSFNKAVRWFFFFNNLWVLDKGFTSWKFLTRMKLKKKKKLARSTNKERQTQIETCYVWEIYIWQKWQSKTMIKKGYLIND